METGSGLFATLFSVTPPNIIFTILIIILVLIDLILKKDLKAQIVSIGVLGTFVGIFIGLQNFDPTSMKESVYHILEGLKTAFATSILGMGSAIFLSIYQKIRDQISDDSKSEEEIMIEINRKLDNLENLSFLPRLDNSLLITKLEQMMGKMQGGGNGGGNDSSEAILKTLIEIKNQNIRANFEISKLLSENFTTLNNSMAEATRQLSKGATQEIINALQGVIKNFNDNLMEQFGGNFDKLNQAVIKLVEWQDKYKVHVEDMENRFELSTVSIEKAEKSIVTISNSNENILQVYENLKEIIETYKSQTDGLKTNMESIADIIPKTTDMFEKMDSQLSSFSESFKDMSLTVTTGNKLQKDSFIEMNDTVINLINQNSSYITGVFQQSMKSITDNFQHAYDSLERQKYEINVITNYFKVMGEQIPEALRVSLDELNKALSSMTTKFQKDYEDVIYRYKDNINETRY